MTTTDLATALTACAAGLCPLEAGTALLIAEGTFLRRDDFTRRFIEHGTSDGTPMAAIDWDAAVTALNSGQIPCSSGERRILLLAASIAGGIPVSLCDTLPGTDPRNARLVLKATARAMGTGIWDNKPALPNAAGGPAMFDDVIGLQPEQAARWTALAEQCRPVLAVQGMEAVQALLAEQRVSIIQAIAITRELLGREKTPLRTAIDIVTESKARTPETPN